MALRASWRSAGAPWPATPPRSPVASTRPAGWAYPRCHCQVFGAVIPACEAASVSAKASESARALGGALESELCLENLLAGVPASGAVAWAPATGCPLTGQGPACSEAATRYPQAKGSELATQHARHLPHFHEQGFLTKARRLASLWSNPAREDSELVPSWRGWGCRQCSRAQRPAAKGQRRLGRGQGPGQ